MNELRPPDLSIVIVSYNVRDLLEQCLKSVDGRQWSVISSRLATDAYVTTSEVLVVDNASTDGSAAMVREVFPWVRLLENAENRGFAAANNQAFSETRGRYVLMLNPDTVVRPGALEVLIRFMDAHPRAGACGGRLLYGDGSPQHSAFAFPTLAQVWLDFFPMNWRLTESRLNGRYPRSWYARKLPFLIDHPLGADLLVRRETSEQVGWLDDRYFMYCEEIDWCIRIKRAGWQIWCVPEAEIVHYEARSTRQFRDAMFVELWRSRFRLFDEHYSPAFRWAARWIVRVGLSRASNRVQAAARAKQMGEEELQQRLEAYARVREMTLPAERPRSAEI
jgi:hypothetical protein